MSQFEYYSILEVERTASAEEIKKAYRKKAMELHPDRHGGDKDKEAKFKKLNEAYSVLSDDQKKAHYDRFGTMENHGNGFGGFQWGFDVDIGDIFSSFFGGGFGGNTSRRRADIGEDIEIGLKISLEDAIRWSNRSIEFSRETTCGTCHGKGGKTETCGTCHGAGQIRERVQTIFGVMEQSRPCHTCHGTGEKIIEKCETCNGKGKTTEKISKTIDVPAGIENGMSIKMRGEGHGGKDGNGDLYITFSVPNEEAGLSRDGINLHYTARVSPAEAALGNAHMVEIPILGKKPLDLKSGTQSGTVLTFREEGLPRLDRKGHKWDLYIHIDIDIPTKLSKDQKALYEALLQIEWGKKMKKGFIEGLFGE